GPIRFGMSRKQVAEVMSKEKGALPLSKRGEIDCFFQACFQISYTPREEVDFIEVASGGPQLIFQGADLFKLSAADLVRHVEKVDKADLDLCKPPSDYLFLKLILTLSEPRFDNEPHSGIPDRYEAIGLGNEKYLAAIRRILGEDLFKKRWSDNTKPKASGKKAVNKLLAMGAKLALDDQGDVRRVQFLSHWLTKPLADSDLVDLTGFNNLEA